MHTIHPSVKDEVPEYEKLYEPVSRGLSFDAASKIEALSWKTTDKLVEAFAEGDSVQEIIPTPMQEVINESEDDDLFKKLSQIEIEFIKAALEENFTQQERIASSSGSLVDVIADKINTMSADIRGDILLEDIGWGYAVIEDYIEETKGALNYD